MPKSNLIKRWQEDTYGFSIVEDKTTNGGSVTNRGKLITQKDDPTIKWDEDNKRAN